MKTCSKCGVDKPLSDFRHRSPGALRSDCKDCQNARARGAYQENREARLAYRREYCAKHPGKNAADSAAWRKKYPEKAAASDALKYIKHPGRAAAATAEWRLANPGRDAANHAAFRAAYPAKVNARNAARKAGQLQATPIWANLFFIEEIYDLAARRTKATGVEHHVDHIVPLRSKLVCGLHVEANLAVIPAAQNIAKGNRHWPEMPGAHACA